MGLRQLGIFLLNPEFRGGFVNFITLQGCSFVIGIKLLRFLGFKKINLILIGSSSIFGHFIIAMLLMGLGYFIKGNYLVFLTLLVSIIILFKLTFEDVKLISKAIRYSPIILIVSSVSFLVASNATYGGDTTTYWGLASSFIKGNYPVMLPWQPNNLPVYHISTFLLLGWHSSLTKLSIPVTHTLLSWVWMTDYIILILGIIISSKVNKLLIIPSFLMAVITQGGPIFWHGKVQELLKLIKYEDTSVRYETIKGSAGGGANSFPSLMYANFQLLGIISSIITLYLSSSIKNITNKVVIVLSSLTSFIASSDESLFPAVLACVTISLLLRKKYRYLVTYFTLTIVTMFVFQNAIRDSILLPANPPRFNLVIPGTPDWFTRFHFTSGYVTDAWYVIPQFVTLMIILIYSLKRKNDLILTISLFSLICFLLGLVIKNTYWPANSIRLINTSSRISSILFILILFKIVELRKKSISAISVILILSLMPSLITEYKYLYLFMSAKQHQNIITMSNTKSDELEFVSNNLKYNESVLILDQYPDEGVYSPLTLNAIQFYGLRVPLFSSKPKMMNAETGGEWYDAVSSLNPEIIKSLGVKYFFTNTKGEKRLTNVLKSYDLELIAENKNGKIWKILKLPQSTTLPSIVEATRTIEHDKTVYLDKFIDPSIRRGLLERIANNVLHGPNYAIGGDWYMYRESELPRIEDQPEWKNEEYVILSTEKKDIETIADNYIKIYTHPKFNIWKKEKIR